MYFFFGLGLEGVWGDCICMLNGGLGRGGEGIERVVMRGFL